MRENEKNKKKEKRENKKKSDEKKKYHGMEEGDILINSWENKQHFLKTCNYKESFKLAG